MSKEIEALYSQIKERLANGDNTVVAIWKRNGDVMRRYEV